MKLEDSCHCGRIDFTVESETPYPYRRCYCVLCRKTNGGSGYTINVMGEAETLHINGRQQVWEQSLQVAADRLAGYDRTIGKSSNP